MGENKITLQEALQSHEDLLAFVAQEALSEEYLGEKRAVEEGPHPTDEMLYGHVWDAVDEKISRIIRKHIAFCGICAKKVLQIRRVKQESKEKLLNWANELPSVAAPALRIEDVLATDFWKPEGIGMRATAAQGTHKQEHLFKNGTIRIECDWDEQTAGQPAFIWLSWKVTMPGVHQFQVQFIHPETKQTYYEITLGKEGENMFSRDELGFDPSTEEWAIKVL